MEETKELTLNFEDMWPGFEKENNYFYRLLSKKYKIVIADNPKILIYGVFGNAHKRYNCTKVHFISENYRPDFSDCDYAFSFDYPEKNDRNYRLPLYALYFELYSNNGQITLNDLTQPLSDIEAIKILKNKKNFCCMVVSNPSCQLRIDFFNKLSKYKKVDSGGRVLNNIGGPIKDKLKFLNDYKFVISFENSSHPGYTTEKILDGFIGRCIPIYWGNEVVGREFNAQAFINIHDFDDFSAAIDRIIEIDSDDDLFLEYIKRPKYINGVEYINTRPSSVLNRFEEIINGTTGPVNRGLIHKGKLLFWVMQDKKKLIEIARNFNQSFYRFRDLSK